ncbi:MAG: VCBS repeat-containing protein [Vicinamibacterales bacterium]
MKRVWVLVAVTALAVAAAFVIQLRRSGLTVAEMFAGPPPSLAETIEQSRATARVGARLDVLTPSPVGLPVAPDDRPAIANVAVADLDQDGLPDILVADAAANQVSWIRQSPAGTFTETPLGEVAGPAHVTAVDLDGDGDLDIAVASLGVLFPNNAPIGAVIVLENDGRQSFTRRVLVDQIARVSDVEAGDLDGDGDVDLAVAQFGYDQGETRWLENQGGWRFESHPLQSLSGPINAVVADVDGDRDLDIVSLVSQEWEEIYVFVNDGRGGFTPTRIFGASNEDFGSSWISVADLDGDGDPDVLYSNGDAFDYAPPTGRNWNGVQWLENRGNVNFRYHRVGDFLGASSPQAADMDGDGDIDLVVVSAYNDWERPDALSLAWFENDGSMNFTLRPITGSPTHLITLAIGDLNGDGRPDLVTGGMHMSFPFDRMSRVTAWTQAADGTGRR